MKLGRHFFQTDIIFLKHNSLVLKLLRDILRRNQLSFSARLLQYSSVSLSLMLCLQLCQVLVSFQKLGQNYVHLRVNFLGSDYCLHAMNRDVRFSCNTCWLFLDSTDLKMPSGRKVDGIWNYFESYLTNPKKPVNCAVTCFTPWFIFSDLVKWLSSTWAARTRTSLAMSYLQRADLIWFFVYYRSFP